MGPKNEARMQTGESWRAPTGEPPPALLKPVLPSDFSIKRTMLFFPDTPAAMSPHPHTQTLGNEREDTSHSTFPIRPQGPPWI